MNTKLKIPGAANYNKNDSGYLKASLTLLLHTTALKTALMWVYRDLLEAKKIRISHRDIICVCWFVVVLVCN